MDMMIAGEPVDAFSMIVHRDRAESQGREIALKLKDVIPRQLFTVAIQACIGGKIIARESILKSILNNIIPPFRAFVKFCPFCDMFILTIL